MTSTLASIKSGARATSAVEGRASGADGIFKHTTSSTASNVNANAGISQNQNQNQAQSSGMTTNLSSFMENLASDSSLRVFLDPDFNVEEYIEAEYSKRTITAALDSSERASTSISAFVREEVIKRQDELLQEVETVSELEEQIEFVQQGVNALVDASNSLMKAMVVPYKPMEVGIVKLRNMNHGVRLLKIVHRFRFCVRRLRSAGFISASSGSVTVNAVTGIPSNILPDLGESLAAQGSLSMDGTEELRLASVADSIIELEELLKISGAELERIDLVRTDIPVVKRMIESARPRAVNGLRRALAAKDKPNVALALQALSDLKVLEDRVSGEVARLISATQTTISEGLDPNKSIRVANASKSDKPTMSRDAWLRFENMVTQLTAQCEQVVILQTALENTPSNETHMPLIHSFESGASSSIVDSYLSMLSASMQETMDSLVKAKPKTPLADLCKNLLVDFFRMKRLFRNLSESIYRTAVVSASADVSFSKPVTTKNELDRYIIQATQPMEDAYFSKMQSAMLELLGQYLAFLNIYTKEAVSTIAGSPTTSSHPASTSVNVLAKIVELRSVEKVTMGQLVSLIGKAYIETHEDIRMAIKMISQLNSLLKVLCADAGKSLDASKSHATRSSLFATANLVSMTVRRIYGCLLPSGGASSEQEQHTVGDGGDTELPSLISARKQTEKVVLEVQVDGLLSECNSLDQLCESILHDTCDDLKKSLEVELDAIIRQKIIDAKPSSGAGGNLGASESAFITKIVKLLEEFSSYWKESLKMPIVLAQLRPLASHILISYIRRIALISPLTEAMKLKFTTDSAMLELSVSSNLCAIREFSSSHDALSNMKRLIFMETEKIAELLEASNLKSVDVLASALLGNNVADGSFAENGAPAAETVKDSNYESLVSILNKVPISVLVFHLLGRYPEACAEFFKHLVTFIQSSAASTNAAASAMAYPLGSSANTIAKWMEHHNDMELVKSFQSWGSSSKFRGRVELSVADALVVAYIRAQG